MRASEWIGAIGRWVVGLWLLRLAFYGVNFAALWSALADLRAAWLAVALATVIAGTGAKLWRWEKLLRPVLPAIDRGRILGGLLMGQAVNTVLPLRSGDLARTAAVAPVGEGETGAILAGIGVEKAMDLMALALSVAVVLPWLPQRLLPLHWAWLLALALAALGLMVAAVLASRRIWGAMRPRLPSLPFDLQKPIRRWGDQMVEGLSRMRSGKGFLSVLGLTLLAWILMYLTNLAMLAGLGLHPPAVASLLVLALVHIGLAPRLMPGNVGPFYFFARIGLGAFGYPAAQTTAFALALHAVVTFPPLVGGGLYMLIRKAAR